MVTTRNEEVLRVMNTSLTHPLKRLSDQDGWTMFKRRAFADGGAIETDNLVGIGKEIVRTCQGLPLAIRIAGGLMRSKKSEKECSEILASLQNISDGVLPVLKLSYDNLKPSSLKQCFASCSIFPKDSAIRKDKLIQIWLALGLLQPHGRSNSVMENIGNSYFNTLLLNSLFQDAKKDEYENITSCKMHDLVHDLASKIFCLTSEAEVNDDFEIVHLSLVSACGEVRKISSGKFPRLRTLYLNGGLIGDNFKNFKCLRVLILINYDISELPGSIGGLKHLRYLDISETDIHTLPDDVSKLYNLQTLRVSDLEEFPKKLGKLFKLRHVYVEGIRGCQIGRLRDVDQLTGKLNIYGLKHVGDKEEAKLSNKLQIQALGFYWADKREGRNEDVSEEEALNDAHVLERLRPHSNLKGLRIKDFMGGSFASWMMMESQSSLYNLVKIKLKDCRRCEEVPALGHLPCLKVVVIWGMDNVKCIGPEFYGKQMVGGGGSTSTGAATSFPALRELTLCDMRKLEEWSEAEHLSLVFPCLEVLNIQWCNGLRTIPSHFPFVKELTIWGINSLALGKMSTTLTSLTSLDLSSVDGSEVQIRVEELLGNNRLLIHLTIAVCEELLYLPTSLLALESLQVSFCPKLRALPELCTSLEVLTIKDCPAVVSLPDFPLGLRNLSIEDCPAVVSLPDFPLGLRNLSIKACPAVVSLPDFLLGLRNLTIEDCPAVVSLPDFPLGLRNLELSRFSAELDYFPWPSNPTSSYLQELRLDGWPKLTSLPEQLQHLSALTSLHLFGFVGLVALPEWLGKLSSLRFLRIDSCNNLMSMPTAEAMQLLAKLRGLYIFGCPLLAKRCTQGTCPEWNKIAHVPKIYIDWMKYDEVLDSWLSYLHVL